MTSTRALSAIATCSRAWPRSLARIPRVISSMFTSNGNNTYGVKFYVDGVAEYVTVNNSLANDVNSGADIWASLAEKAYTQLQTSGVVTGSRYQ